MGFWIYMFIMNVILPFSMIGFGKYFIKKAPKEINMVFGYRTSMSTKNMDTWKFAHHHCGKIWYIFGWILLVITIAGMLLVIGKEEDMIGTVSGVIIGIQLVFLIGSIVPTEIALRKRFDKNGKRR